MDYAEKKYDASDVECHACPVGKAVKARAVNEMARDHPDSGDLFTKTGAGKTRTTTDGTCSDDKSITSRCLVMYNSWGLEVRSRLSSTASRHWSVRDASESSRATLPEPRVKVDLYQPENLLVLV